MYGLDFKTAFPRKSVPTERLLGLIDVAEPIAQSRLRERRLKKYDVARENWIGWTTVWLWSNAAGKNMEIPALQLTDGLL